jgi:hypothetical protein
MAWGRRARYRYGNPDQGQEEIISLVRDLPASVHVTTGVGGGYPDLTVGFQGLTVLVEVKRPDGKPSQRKLRDSQDRFLATWRGGPVLKIDNGMDLVQQLIHIDRRTAPVRGATDRFEPGTAQAILADCLAAADGLVVDADDLPGLIRKLRKAAP